MSLQDSASLESLSLAELRDLCGTLVGEMRRLQAESQALRDESMHVWTSGNRGGDIGHP